MGREQTQKYARIFPSPLKSSIEQKTITNPNLQTATSIGFNTSLHAMPVPSHFVKVGKGQNVFGIGGRNIDDPTTPKIERDYTINPYKNEAQLNFMKFTQQLSTDILGENFFKNLPVPEPASPTGGNGNGNGKCVEDDPTCGVKEFFMGVPAGTYCKCPSWFPNGTTTETKCECEACKNGTGDCSNKKPCCNAWDVLCEMGGECSKTKPPDEECDLGCLLTGRGCDCGCKDMKPCTTCDSDVCQECNAWDLQCEDCHKKNGTCTPPPPEKTWVFWAKIIAVVIGIGVFLWLLRPLFSRGSKPTGGFTITPA